MYRKIQSLLVIASHCTVIAQSLQVIGSHCTVIASHCEVIVAVAVVEHISNSAKNVAISAKNDSQ